MFQNCMLYDGGSCNRQVIAEERVEENVCVMVFRDECKSSHPSDCYEWHIPADLRVTVEAPMRLYSHVGYEHPLLARWEPRVVYTYVLLHLRPCFHVCPFISNPGCLII